MALKARLRQHYKYFLNNFQTRWSDNDQYGHVNNAIYYHYYDTIINQYLTTKCSLVPTKSTSIGLCVHSSSDYFKPVEFPNTLDLALAVTKLGKSSVTYEVGVFESGKDEVCAVGKFVHVFVDSEGRRPVGIQGDIRRGLEELLVDHERGNGAKL
ncbi:hypothetical protein TWF569_006791 [Orbilia oligospora]|uniref:Uncharacterized protein n=1 Tax=Orbilia oligospora TaxID=2813651 RepID=A0A7C8JTY4_ORBOL|nr:hypothetical protein TWF706_011776 [Orbilia oligospora]KAF3089369.1 hypothetical protein TWF102_009639 [Orbilia oligospora]KAF3109688.1 hypothetical protein TWF103_005055 [Orbilia oligospora]KAF3125730.1 hypothetical protein TWF703_010718 [Orbilia oligospora]KAF3144585.1 hypothetical protein TWF594_004740 [Orbilia oligospora]